MLETLMAGLGDVTPRGIRIFYFRYLFLKRMLSLVPDENRLEMRLLRGLGTC